VEVQHIAGPGGASSDWEAAFAAAVEQGADAVLVLHGPSSVGNISTIASLATEHRLPAIHALKLFTDRGGLMAYEARSSEIVPHVADYVDRILHGARPAELPVELPSHYDLIVNLQAARALGLTFSRDFLARVDEVIE
jgi:putative ABC transport system substrate-binding protein